jgi:type IV pilus assembly protein PilN
VKTLGKHGGDAQAALVLDLLRERRRLRGQESLSGTLAQRRSVLLRGALIGLALAGGMLLVAAALLVQKGLLQAQMGQLEVYEGQAAALQSELRGRQRKLGQIQHTNRALVNALTSGRSSSALLTALQLSTPAGVQLRSVDASGANLVLKGQAYDPLALQRINALQLELQRSPLLAGPALRLKKVERQPNEPGATGRSTGATPRPAAKPGPVAFELSVPFAPLDPPRQLELLGQLGSEGMARRLKLLRAEGLLP